VQGDVLRARLEELGHLGLTEPQRFLLEPALDTGLAVPGLVQEELAGIGVVEGLPLTSRASSSPAGW
jgi:hypothetical protein